MKNANAEIELVPVKAGEVSWDRARELWNDANNKARLSGDALVELGKVLSALRIEYAAAGAGGGGDRKSAQYKITSNTPVGGDSPKLNQNGWEKKVLEETGIPAWTARRIIENAQYVMMLRDVAGDEKLIRYTDSKRQIVEVEPTEEMRDVARKMLPDVELGLVKPARAWAGVMGEGTRKAGGPSRAAVDNYNVIRRALVSLRNATEIDKWKSLNPHDRAELESLWHQVKLTLPAEWGVGE